MFPKLKVSSCIIAVLSSAFLAFGLYNVHSLSNITEGGVLGLTLLLDHHFSISPAISNFVLNAVCYLIGWRLLGKEFIAYSAFATIGFSAAYKVCEQFDPLWPSLAEHPLLAALIGAVFVGIGAGFCVRVGGAPSGDDALAMSLSHVTHLRVQWIYLISDLCVLGLSLTYIPLSKIMYSLLTVVISGQIIGFIVSPPPIEKIFGKKKKSDPQDFS
ncbi:MAG: YitT family protein [Ruminococcaceae bacterium]|nr:YitT family protein [Oscillospiraceae bacterium]